MLRHQRALTQEELAKLLGVSRQSVIAIETGRRLPSFPLAIAIAQFFEVPVNEVFERSNNEGGEKIITKENIINLNEEDKMRNLPVFDPFEMMRDTSRDFNRLFRSGLFGHLSPVSSMPVTNVLQTDKSVVVEVHVPGYKESEISIEASDESLTVSGEQKELKDEKAKNYFYREASKSAFSRTIPLPTKIASEKAEADLQDGVLTIILPKAEPDQTKSKRIEIKRS